MVMLIDHGNSADAAAADDDDGDDDGDDLIRARWRALGGARACRKCGKIPWQVSRRLEPGFMLDGGFWFCT